MNYLGQLLNLSFIGVLVNKKIISPAQGRLVEGAIYTLGIGIITYFLNALDTGNFTNWKATLIALIVGSAKTLASGLAKSYRDNLVEKQKILDQVNTNV